MTEEEWLACEDAREMLGRVTFNFSARKMRLLAVACCRCSRQLLLNPSHRAAVDLAERFAEGLATERERAEAYQRTDDIAAGLRAELAEREIRRWAEAVAVLNALRLPGADAADTVWNLQRASPRKSTSKQLVARLRDIVGNPFQPSDPVPRTTDVMLLAQGIYDDRAFDRLPILADALQDAGCESQDVLNHCRDASATHVRGCWVIDLVLGKE